MGIAELLPRIVKENVIETILPLVLLLLWFRLQVVRQEAGKNLPLNVSVLQETPGNPFGTFYEDRTINPDILIIKTEVGGEFVELYL